MFTALTNKSNHEFSPPSLKEEPSFIIFSVLLSKKEIHTFFRTKKLKVTDVKTLKVTLICMYDGNKPVGFSAGQWGLVLLRRDPGSRLGKVGFSECGRTEGWWVL